jgi:hypothetical protein
VSSPSFQPASGSIVKTALFVLSVGRSGTSAFAGLLSLCGATLPGPLMGAAKSNPRGHFEPLKAVQINNAFLHRNGATFFDPSLRLQSKVPIDSAAGQAFVAELVELFSTWPDDDLLVIKDPRITVISRAVPSQSLD